MRNDQPALLSAAVVNHYKTAVQLRRFKPCSYLLSPEAQHRDRELLSWPKFELGNCRLRMDSIEIDAIAFLLRLLLFHLPRLIKTMMVWRLKSKSDSLSLPQLCQLSPAWHDS